MYSGDGNTRLSLHSETNSILILPDLIIWWDIYYKLRTMKKILLILLTLLTIQSFACHTTSLALVSAPTPIGGGQYSTVVRACFGQYTAGNWGGTNNFQLVVGGTTFASFSPATITNNYFAYTTASCSGPNCFMGTCAAVSATATGVLISSTIIKYTTTSSIPVGYPIVPDDNETCAGTSTSYCKNITVVTNGYPTSISLNGNVEVTTPEICVIVCGHSASYAGGPCNGTFNPNMTISISPLPIELLYFQGYKTSCGINYLIWETATEMNNDRFEIERSIDAINFEKIVMIKGAGNSTSNNKYNFVDSKPSQQLNYYRLRQIDYDNKSEVSSIISIDNSCDKNVTIIKTVNLLGQEVGENYSGIKIYYYSNGSVVKKY